MYAVLFFSVYPLVHVNLLGPISHPEIEDRGAKRVLLEKEYQCSLSPYEKVRTSKEDDVSSFKNAHILGLV